VIRDALLINLIIFIKSLILIFFFFLFFQPKIVPKDVTNVVDKSNEKRNYKEEEEEEELSKKEDEISIVDRLDEIEIHEKICQNILDGIIDVIELMDESVSRIENNQLNSKKRENSVTSEEFREVISKLDENIEENDEEGKCGNIIQLCVYHLKQLVHNFIHLIIFDEKIANEDEYFKSLFHLNSILRRPSSSSMIINDDNYSTREDVVKFKQNSFEYLSSFKQLNKFLIKLFLFPRAYANNQQLNLILATNDLNQNYHQFEDWLKDLFIISCLNQSDNENIFEFQSITINTLLEFFFISESFYSSLSEFNSSNSSVKLLVTTVFTHKQLNLIYNESSIGEIIGSKLWSYLSHKPNNSNTDTFKYHKRAATLFCLLHELLPNNLCEDIISKSLNGDETMQLDTIRRFIHLWHWSKELQNNTTQQQNRKIVKTFERCVFMLIDLIDKSTSPVNKLIQEWLNKSINDGDLCRILDILIISLLHPNTTRLSIQFYNKLANDSSKVLNSDQKLKISSSTSDDYESKVYAISNEKGNVVYHVNNEISDRLKKGGEQSQTESKIKRNNLELSIDKISLRVNPFSPANIEYNTDEEEESSAGQLLNVRRAISENNFIEKYRAMKLEQKLGNENELFDVIDENYAYMLLYSQSYDNIRVLFVLKSFDKILKQCKKEFILALCKTKIFDNEIQTFYNTKLLDLFIRHLKSIYGHNFYSNSNSEFLQQISRNLNLKNLTYLEIILFILMFYIRSFSIQTKDSSSNQQKGEEDMCGNKNVQIYCIQILSKLIQELINISQNINSNILQFDDLTQFSQYIQEMLDKCKIQKTLLHCLFSTTSSTNTKKEKTLTRLIIEENLKNINQQTQYAFICELINCIQNLINLEYVLSATGGASLNTSGVVGSKSSTPQKISQQKFENDDYLITKSNASEMKFFIQSSQTSTQTSRYIQHLPIISQSMFISSVLYYLRHLSLFEFHLPILNLIRISLPFTGTALKSWSSFIIEQLSSNLMQIVNLYEIKSSNDGGGLNKQKHLLSNINIPDFFVLIVKQLSCLLHFSLLITNFVHLNIDNSTAATTPTTSTAAASDTIHESFQNDANILIKSHKQSIIDMDGYQLQAKDSLTNHLPSILSRMTHIWKAMNQSEAFGNDHSAWFLGNPKAIKKHISEMLSPIAANHGVSFTIAIGTVWGEKKKKSKLNKGQFELDHKVLIEVIKSLKSSFSISFILQNITEIIRNSNTILKEKV
jgi:hypothetical protein